MTENLSTLLSSGNLIALNLLLQTSCLLVAVLFLATRIRNNAAARYAVLFAGLISLPLVGLSSILLQSGESSLLRLELDSSSLLAWEQFSLPLLDQPDTAALRARDESTEMIGVNATRDVSQSFNLISLALGLMRLPFIPVVLFFWALGLLVHGLGLLRSYKHLLSLIRRSRSMDANEEIALRGCFAGALVLPESLSVRISSDVASPILAGISQPLILLPENTLARFAPGQVRAVMRHELAHYHRRDPLANLLQKFIVAIFWIHPLVHRLDQMLAQAREEVCDNYVLTHESAVDYGETLLQLCSVERNDRGSAASETKSSMLQMRVVGDVWNIEQRITGLLNQERERVMRLTTRSKILLNVTIVSSALAISACQVGAQTDVTAAAATDEREVQSVETLSQEMMRAITDIQDVMQAESDSGSNMDRAKEMLDALYEERYERMNGFEKATLYNFYTNYYLSIEDYAAAADTFELLLEIDTLRDDIRLRALRSLGQLYAALENWGESIRYYELWQGAAGESDHVVLQGLSYANYQLENFADALPHWIDYMELMQAQGETLQRDDYAYLNGLHFTLENWEQALEVTKQMILRFNTETDWNNLRAIHRELDQLESADSTADSV